MCVRIVFYEHCDFVHENVSKIEFDATAVAKRSISLLGGRVVAG